MSVGSEIRQGRLERPVDPDRDHVIGPGDAPVTLGNTAGGVLLVALLNFSQTRNDRFRDRDCSALELPWREWCFGVGTGRPESREP